MKLTRGVRVWVGVLLMLLSLGCCPVEERYDSAAFESSSKPSDIPAAEAAPDVMASDSPDTAAFSIRDWRSRLENRQAMCRFGVELFGINSIHAALNHYGAPDRIEFYGEWVQLEYDSGGRRRVRLEFSLLTGKFEGSSADL